MTIAALIAAGPLRQGAAGDAVKTIQLALRARGYPLTGTGWFGPATDTAVEDFQRRSGLPATGVVDGPTARALDVPSGVAKPSVPLWLAVSLAHLGLKEAPGAANNRELVADIKSVAPDYQNDATSRSGRFPGERDAVFRAELVEFVIDGGV